MLTLAFAIGLSLVISAACSLTETVLYSVSWAHIEMLRKKGGSAGNALFEMRARIDKPIAAVLTLNTVANTAGSAIAGAAFAAVFGTEHMWAFALAFTVLVLAFGEIVPKTLGVAYANALSTVLVRPLALVVKILTPIIWLTSMLTRMVTPATTGPQVSEDDIRAITSLSRQAGRIQPFEERTIRNILSLDQKRVRDIMTPRTVVFSLPADMSIGEAYQMPQLWHFSRIPVFGEDNEDLVGIVSRRILGQRSAAGESETLLGDVMLPLQYVLESHTLDKLLQEFLNTRTHLFAVLDEYGGLAGVISLEDVLEEILGREIIDESDKVADLRALARESRTALTKAAMQETPVKAG